MRRFIFFTTFCLLVLPSIVFSQDLSDPALQAAVNSANEAVPNLGRPDRWEFELLLPTRDSALSCPIVTGVQLPQAVRPVIVTLYYGDTGYVVHVGDNGNITQRCDSKFPAMGMQPVPNTPQAADACTVSPAGPFANVRIRPDVDAEQTATIESPRVALGRNEDWTWYLITEGWVAGTVITPVGNCLSNDLSIRSSDIMLIRLQPDQPVSTLPTPIADVTCPANFEGYLPPRIQRGAVTAQVELGGLPNSIRALPSTTAERVGQIQPGRRLDFVWNGPQCNEGYVWWEVEIDGVRGWTAESSVTDNTYFLQPVGSVAVAVPTAAAVIPTPAEEIVAVPAAPVSGGSLLIGSLTSVRQTLALPPGFANLFTWSPAQPDEFSYANQGVVTTAPFPRIDAVPLAVSPEVTATALAYTPDGAYLLVGKSNGVLDVYDVVQRQLRVSVNAHESQINAIAIEPTSNTIATASGSATSADTTWSLRLWDGAGVLAGNGAAAMTRNIRFPYPVTGVGFSADGDALAIIAQTPDAAAFWIYGDAGSGANIFSLALADSRGYAFVTPVPDDTDGDFIYAKGDSLYVLTIETGEERMLARQEGSLITGAAFSPAADPAGKLLVVSSVSLDANPATPVPLYAYNYGTQSAPVVLASESVVGVAFNRDGTALGVRTLDNRLLFYTQP